MVAGGRAVSRPLRLSWGQGSCTGRGAGQWRTSHALDYDDTHFAHVGHLSVGIYPAALAAGEEVDASAEDVVTAFLTGSEAAIRIGMGARTGPLQSRLSPDCYGWRLRCDGRCGTSLWPHPFPDAWPHLACAQRGPQA
ncbi:MmgE/PrpD family protein [uncultured Roseibium sp.]|uniref:MmgE/PrpD family protein n=1 Tax=uncultured Roseibium sp. TaxID=1936171 RepID=UPI003747D970